jgi:hypothetical protein
MESHSARSIIQKVSELIGAVRDDEWIRLPRHQQAFIFQLVRADTGLHATGSAADLSVCRLKIPESSPSTANAVGHTAAVKWVPHSS